MTVKKVLVVGDSIIDEYIFCEASRISPEAPVPVFDTLEVKKTAGGAMNVVQNILSLAKEEIQIDYYGHYDYDYDVFEHLDFVRILGHSQAPLLRKIRVIAKNQQVCRVDVGHHYEEFHADEELESEYDLIVFSDYNKGTVKAVDVNRIHKMWPKTPKIFDMKVLHSGFDVDHNWFRTIVKCNESEYNSSIKFISKHWLEELVVTKSEKGFELVKTDKSITSENQDQIVDVTGAGDVFCAGMAVGLLEGRTIEEACRFANKAAAQKVKRQGTVAIQRKEVND